MKTKLFISWVLLCSLVSFVSCNEKEPEPEILNPEIRLSSTSVEAMPEGGEYSISYTLTNPAEGAMIEARCNADWIGSFKYEESGKITFLVAANEEKENREAEVEVVYPGISPAPKFSVLQSAATVLTVNPSADITVPAEGQELTFTVGHNTEFEAAVDVEWIEKESATKTYSEEKMKFNVVANETSEERTGTITFSSIDGKEKVTVKVKQSGAVLNILDDPNEYFLPMVDALGQDYEECGVLEYEESLGHTPDTQFPGFWTFKTGKKLFFMTGYMNGWEGTINEVVLKSEDSANIRSEQVRKWVESMDFVFVQTRTDGDDTFKHKEMDLWLLLHYTPYGETDFPGVQISNMEYEYW